MQIQNYYHYSFLWKLIVFTVNEHENICIAGLNSRDGHAIVYFAAYAKYRIKKRCRQNRQVVLY
jgi:hypothetical protein